MKTPAESREGVMTQPEDAGTCMPAISRASVITETQVEIAGHPSRTQSSSSKWKLGGGHSIVRYLQRSSEQVVNQRARQFATASLFAEGREFAPFVRRFTALMMLSTLIAVLGVLADSTAVVIGAMLVAPLMSPILGLAVAVVMGWPMRALRQASIAAVGAAGAIALATFVSFIFPGSPDPLPNELMARTSPNLLDLGVALVAGAAGAYANARKQAADAISGVAVAVALVPPLAVVGICLQLAEWKLALGAFLLFLANVVGIMLSASLTFVACGLVPAARLDKRMLAPGLRLAVLAALLLVFPLHLSRRQVLPRVGEAGDVTAAVTRFFDETGDAEDLVDSTASITDDVATVHLMVSARADTPSPSTIASQLADELGLAVEVNVHVMADTSASSVAEPD